MVLPHNRGHQWSDTPAAAPVSLAALLPDQQPGACHLPRPGGDGTQMILIRGAFAFASEVKRPLLARLPAGLHLGGDPGRGLKMAARTWRRCSPRAAACLTRVGERLPGCEPGRYTPALG